MKFFYIAFATVSLFSASLQERSTQSILSLKHREYKGIGYDTGYTTGGLFLAPVWRHEFLPFLDARFHVLNNGRFAFNGGLGLRAPVTESWLAGGNLYYDYRSSEDLSPSQIAGGLEALGDHVDVRLNGYYPVADDTFFKRQPAEIHGNTVRFKEEAQAALPMIQAEVGAPFTKRCSSAFFYGAVGPYYLFQRDVRGFNLGGSWGVWGRVAVTLSKFIQLEVASTYDKIFHGTIQGMAALRFPIGPRNLSYKNRDVLCAKITQPVARAEIIPIEDPDRYVPLLHPTTGEPAHFIFVDQVNGPIYSLVQAEKASKPGDIIYVHYGKGKPYPGSIRLKPDQILHGGGLPFISGDVGIRSETFGFHPVIGDVELANNGRVMGFNAASVSHKSGNNLVALCHVRDHLEIHGSGRLEVVQVQSPKALLSSSSDLKVYFDNCKLNLEISNDHQANILARNSQIDIARLKAFDQGKLTAIFEKSAIGSLYFENQPDASATLVLNKNKIHDLKCKQESEGPFVIQGAENDLKTFQLDTKTKAQLQWHENSIEPQVSGKGIVERGSQGSDATD